MNQQGSHIRTKNTHDHILDSSLVGECVLDNSDIFLKDEKGFEKMFELYLHGLLVTFVTKEENDLPPIEKVFN